MFYLYELYNSAEKPQESCITWLYNLTSLPEQQTGRLFDIVKYFLMTSYPFPKQALVFTCLQYKSFENTVGKGEIARNEQFLPFPHCFLTVHLSLKDHLLK